MGSISVGLPSDNADGVPHEEGRPVGQREQGSGISDHRRAELERLEGEVGTAKDAASENNRPVAGQQ